MKRTSLTPITLLFISTLVADPALGCSCRPETLRETLDRVDLVFVGRAAGPSLQRSAYRAQLIRVRRLWKGPKIGAIELRSRGSCPALVSSSGYSLIFATRTEGEPENVFWGHLCDAMPVSAMGEELVELGDPLWVSDPDN